MFQDYISEKDKQVLKDNNISTDSNISEPVVRKIRKHNPPGSGIARINKLKKKMKNSGFAKSKRRRKANAKKYKNYK